MCKPAFARARRDNDGRQIGCPVSDHRTECDAQVTEQHGLDPFRTDVPAERGDDETVLAPKYRQKAVLIDGSEGAGPPWALRRALPQIAVGDRGSIDHDLIVFDRDLEPVERSTDGAGAAFARAVESHDRTAFRESVSFVNRNSEFLRLVSDLPRHWCASDCDKA